MLKTPFPVSLSQEAGGEGSEEKEKEKETEEADGEEEPVEPLGLPPADDLPTTGEVPSPDGTPNEEGQYIHAKPNMMIIE